MMEFSLSTYYNAFDIEKNYEYDTSETDKRLESFTSAVALTPETLLNNTELLDEVVEMTHAFPQLSGNQQKQLTYLVTSSFTAVSIQCKNVIDSGDFVDSADIIKQQLERYGYLLFVILSFLGKEDFPSSGSGGSSTKLKQGSVRWKSNTSQVEESLDSLLAFLKLPLARVFVTTPERNLFLDMFIRTVFHLMELPERIKTVNTRKLMFRAVAEAVIKHSLGLTVQNCIIQSLTYYPHLPPFMAELLHVLDSRHEHTVLTDELLREISTMEFNANDANGPKAVSEFLIKLSELSPRLILKQMSSTAQLLDNSNYTLRCSVVETCGNIVVDILKSDGDEANTGDDHETNVASQVDGLISLLQDRFTDKNPYVRTKAIQAMAKIFALPARMPKRRHAVMLIAVRSIEDRTTLVRRNAIKLMYKLLLSHPFSSTHGSQLVESVWQKRLDEVNAELDKILPKANELNNVAKAIEDGEKAENMTEDSDDGLDDASALSKKGGDENEVQNEIDEKDEKNSDGEKENDDDDMDVDSDDEIVPEFPEMSLPDRAIYIKAKLMQQYYHDALLFIHAAQRGADVASMLLFSKNRNEVLESMDYLVLADAYGIKNASEGIRKMLHLVWMKGQSDEGKSISSHLIDCYRDLFLTAPKDATASQSAAIMAKNLIGLTIGASVADLASLEKLLCMMYEAKLINAEVIRVLWHIYNKASSNDPNPEHSVEFIHGSIIVLGMLSLANRMIVDLGIEYLLSVGLGEHAKDDMILCKHSCATILKIVPIGVKIAAAKNFSQEDEAIKRLRNVLFIKTESSEWYGAAEQCIIALFKISPSPEETFTEILGSKAVDTFQNTDTGEAQMIALSQLLFIVGHVAIKSIEYLEKLETQFKKQKHESESKNKEEKEDGENELEMIGGTSEDDFTDAVVYIKEKELLFGENSILARFGPVVRTICTNTADYKNETLQRSAVLCLAKLMCVSSKFCEDNLPLLITIMEKSPDPIIRCNCVLGLGDMAVCFNNLVDENTDFLYRRLTDENIMVQRTCLMTVTFLILAGQVKVKGQLSSMAKCLENEDQGISDMCKLFFTELATKDNAIYNGFIDIFSGLSNDETLEDGSRKRIVKFLVGFIDKEKHQKQLSEKLLVRLMKSQSEKEWDDVAFVLTTIPYKNEAINQAIEGGFKMVSARE